MLFLERLLDLLTQTWDRVAFWVVIPVGRNGAVLRLGKYHRTLEPGLHWKWPMIEEIREHDTVLTTLRLEPQTLTTKDGTVVVVTAMVRYKIRDLQPYVSDIWDARDVLADTTMGSIRQEIGRATLAELLANPPESQVLARVRSKVNRYGFSVMEVTFIDLGQVRTFRIMSHGPMNIDN